MKELLNENSSVNLDEKINELTELVNLNFKYKATYL